MTLGAMDEGFTVSARSVDDEKVADKNGMGCGRRGKEEAQLVLLVVLWRKRSLVHLTVPRLKAGRMCNYFALNQFFFPCAR